MYVCILNSKIVVRVILVETVVTQHVNISSLSSYSYI